MNIGILGTGTVGETIASALIDRGHSVLMGSRKAGNEKAQAWAKKRGKLASEGSFDDAVKFGTVLFVCLNGEHALSVMRSVSTEHTAGKIVFDLTNPLDFSQGMPPSILRDFQNISLGEQIQEALPQAHVIKALNTMNCQVMVDARKVASAHHDLFLCGNDATAKNQAKHFLVDNFYWKPEHLIDLGDIRAARTTEGFVPFWVLVLQATGTPLFNFRVVQ